MPLEELRDLAAHLCELVLDLEGDLSTGSGNPATLALGSSTPNAVVDVVGEGVLETGLFCDAIHTDLPCDVYSNTIAREKGLRRQFSAFAFCHPVRIHYFTHFLQK